MSGRAVLAAAGVALGLSAASVASSGSGAAECEARLAQTLAEMESRPLLKEELATGLMWLRLDAETALAEGDVASCLEGVRVVEQILGLDSPD